MPKDKGQHCQEVLKSPQCGDFKGLRSAALCKAWAMKNEKHLEKLPLKDAWVLIKTQCSRK